MAFIEFLVVTITALLASVVYHQAIYGGIPPLLQYAGASLLLGSIYALFCLLDDQYDLLGEKWRRNCIARAARAVALAFIFFLAISFLFKIADGYSRGTFLTQIIAVFPALIIARTLLAHGITTAANSGRLSGHRLVIVSLGQNGFSQIDHKVCDLPHQTLASYNIDIADLDQASAGDLQERLSEIRDECRKIKGDVVLLTFEAQAAKHVSQVVEVFSELPVRMQLLPVDLLPILQSSKINTSGQARVLEISSRPSSLFDRLVKRSFDVAVAGVSVFVFSPLLLLTAIAIKFDSPGPILFRQPRQGFNNEPIEVFKFRTMTHCPENAPFRQATRNDDRVTRIGRILRRVNIDELPQLFNVLRGDMSIVGPRPHVLEHNGMFLNSIKLLSKRHNVKPGITGWAQINGYRGETDTHEKMLKRIEHDLYYVDNWSFFFDVKILVMTVLSKKAYDNAF